MYQICTFLTTNYPDTTIIFLTPVNITRQITANVAPLNDYRSAIYQMATRFKFNVVDGSTIGLPTEKQNWGNAMIDDSDGIHPTLLGHYQYYKGLCTKLL